MHNENDELLTKENRVRQLLKQKTLDALLLRRISSFAWITGGAASHVPINTENGVSSILITLDSKYIITNNIEEPRLQREELLASKGFSFQVSQWHSTANTVAQLTKGMQLGCDTAYPGAINLATEISSLRSQLLPQEIERYRALGKDCGEALENAARAVRPGMSETQIAGLISAEVWLRGITPTNVLVAADERVFLFRHPLPTTKPLEKYAMLVLGGRREGLIISCTRLVHFGPLPSELARKQESTARVDAAFICATRPGALAADIFREGLEAYANEGYPEEWKLHHQGGCAGYEGREYKANLESTQVVQEGQAFAWNPSITGTKSEDTIIVGSDKNEIISATGTWPSLEIEYHGKLTLRPAILVND